MKSVQRVVQRIDGWTALARGVDAVDLARPVELHPTLEWGTEWVGGCTPRVACLIHRRDHVVQHLDRVEINNALVGQVKEGGTFYI